MAVADQDQHSSSEWINMVVTNQYRHYSKKRVNIKICGRVPSFECNRNLYRQVSCVLVLWLLNYALQVQPQDEKKMKNNNNMDKLNVYIIFSSIT